MSTPRKNVLDVSRLSDLRLEIFYFTWRQPKNLPTTSFLKIKKDFRGQNVSSKWQFVFPTIINHTPLVAIDLIIENEFKRS